MRSIFRFLPFISLILFFSCEKPKSDKHYWKKFETYDFSIQFPQEFELNDVTVDPTHRIYIFKGLAEKSDSFNIQQIDMGVLVDTMLRDGKPISYQDFDTLAAYWIGWDTSYHVVCDLMLYDTYGYNRIHMGTNIRFQRHLKNCTSGRKKDKKSFGFYFQCNEDLFERKYPLGLEIFRTFTLK
jgi:hypothetical protein